MRCNWLKRLNQLRLSTLPKPHLSVECLHNTAASTIQNLHLWRCRGHHSLISYPTLRALFIFSNYFTHLLESFETLWTCVYHLLALIFCLRCICHIFISPQILWIYKHCRFTLGWPLCCLSLQRLFMLLWGWRTYRLLSFLCDRVRLNLHLVNLELWSHLQIVSYTFFTKNRPWRGRH